MVRSARDLPLVLDVLTGFDPRDPAMRQEVAARPDGGLRRVAGLRAGVPTSYFRDHCDQHTLDRFAEALDRLRALGVEVVPVDLEYAELHQPVGRTIISAEMSSLHEPMRERIAEYDDLLGSRLEAASSISARDYLGSLRLRHLLQRDFERAMAVSTCCLPTTPTVAPPLDTLHVRTADGEVLPWLEVAARNTFPLNITGMPAVSVPVPGPGLPVGLQIAARPQHDDLVVQLAAAFEEEGEKPARTRHHPNV